MYNSNDVATRIKQCAEEKKISMRQVLINAGLGFNTMTAYKTSMPKADNLAKIADVLDCSVDYLLGRENKKEAPLPVPMLGKDAQRLLDMYGEMSKESKDQVMRYVTSLYYVDRANRSAQYSGALAAYEGGTQQHTISKEAAEKVRRRLEDMEKNT